MEDLDTTTHKKRIIKQVLEYGDIQATDWLRSVYSDADIRAVVSSSAESEWSAKTRNYLNVLYGAQPAKEQRMA